jgi:hypothetical protein
MRIDGGAHQRSEREVGPLRPKSQKIAAQRQILARQLSGMSGIFLRTGRDLQRLHWLAGHVRLELRNVAANYPFERSRTFPGIQPNVGAKDYSRVRCGVVETQLRPSARISARDACAEPMIGVLLGIGRRLPIFVLTTAKDNVASPARTRGNSARSPSRRSV